MAKRCFADRNDDKREMKSSIVTQEQSFCLLEKLSGSLSACVLDSSVRSSPDNLLTCRKGRELR